MVTMEAPRRGRAIDKIGALASQVSRGRCQARGKSRGGSFARPSVFLSSIAVDRFFLFTPKKGSAFLQTRWLLFRCVLLPGHSILTEQRPLHGPKQLKCRNEVAQRGAGFTSSDTSWPFETSGACASVVVDSIAVAPPRQMAGRRRGEMRCAAKCRCVAIALEEVPACPGAKRRIPVTEIR